MTASRSGGSTGLARLRRYREIVRILRRHGLLRILIGRRAVEDEGAVAASIVAAMNDAGVTFIKLGQMMSTRRDALPPAYLRALASLQSDAAPAPPGSIEVVIEHELGMPLDAAFASFEAVPFAAASIAQVHRAVLPDGTAVVVKVQRPGAREQVTVDGDIFLRLARRAEHRAHWAERMGTSRLAQDFMDSLTAEFDYAAEARNIRLFAASIDGDDEVLALPRVVESHTVGAVMTMTRVTGAPTNTSRARLDRLSESERHRLADALLRITLNGILVHGVFHGDLHPGNIHLTDDRRIGLVDFGVVGLMDSETRHLFAALLFAVSVDDSVAATDALLMIASANAEVDVQELRRAVGEIITSIRFQPAADEALVTGLFEIVQTHGIRLPASVIAALRTLASLEETLLTLDPTFAIIDGAKTHARAVLGTFLGPARLAQLGVAQAAVTLVSGRRMPGRAEKIADDLASGHLSVHARIFADTDDRDWVRRRIRSIGRWAIALVLALVGVALIVLGAGPTLSGVPLSAAVGWLFVAGGAAAAVWSAVRSFAER